jgi:hypothetical protein
MIGGRVWLVRFRQVSPNLDRPPLATRRTLDPGSSPSAILAPAAILRGSANGTKRQQRPPLLPLQRAAGRDAASLCALCSGVMVAKLVMPDPNNDSREPRTYECAQCGHCRTYSVEGGSSD